MDSGPGRTDRICSLWSETGEACTEMTAMAALARALELGTKHIVVPSNTGKTALKVLRAAREVYGECELPSICCVTHAIGFREPGGDEMPQGMRNELQNLGVKVLTTTHLMGGIERAANRAWGGAYPAALVANTLKIFGQGTKVAVECAVMALDSGLVPHGEEILSLGGSRSGVDTALVLMPEHASNIFATKILEVVCKPRIG